MRSRETPNAQLQSVAVSELRNACAEAAWGGGEPLERALHGSPRLAAAARGSVAACGQPDSARTAHWAARRAAGAARDAQNGAPGVRAGDTDQDWPPGRHTHVGGRLPPQAQRTCALHVPRVRPALLLAHASGPSPLVTFTGP